ncbi:Saccharopine dehydrogenase-like oxidoreductase [Dictyocoela muelleri]|nr:Saccharopine dehydrogenase-like oxidoreductase [Dictyocoela muelleri]
MFDTIVYGASGITAKYVIERLSKSKLKFAIAGRSRERILKNIPNSHEMTIIEADLSNIDLVTRQCKVLINCAGPYIFSGEQIVESCIKNNTHYFDITGETFFIEKVIHKYHDLAKKNKIFIVHAAGFDSVPADIGVEYLKQKVKGDVTILSSLKLNNFCINYGTYESLVNSFANIDEMRKFRAGNLQKLSVKDESTVDGIENISATKSNDTGFQEKSIVKKLSFSESGKGIKKYLYSEETKSYWVIFMGTDISIVKKTQKSLAEKGVEDPAKYLTYLDVGSFPKFIVFITFFYLTFFLSRFKIGRKLLLTYPNFFTLGWVKKNGPTDQQIEKSNFEFKFTAKGKDKNSEIIKKMKVSGPDPGLKSTPILLVECVKTFIDMIENNSYVKNETENNEERKTGLEIFKGGVVTPGMLFYGTDLVGRLNMNGIIFEVEDE